MQWGIEQDRGSVSFYARSRMRKSLAKEKGKTYHGDAGKRLGAGFEWRV